MTKGGKRGDGCHMVIGGSSRMLFACMMLTCMQRVCGERHVAIPTDWYRDNCFVRPFDLLDRQNIDVNENGLIPIPSNILEHEFAQCFYANGRYCPKGYFCPFGMNGQVEYAQDQFNEYLCNTSDPNQAGGLMNGTDCCDVLTINEGQDIDPRFPVGTEYLACKCGLGKLCMKNIAFPINCPQGYYCPTPRSMKRCPDRHFCSGSTVEPIKCTLLQSCPVGSVKPSSELALVVFFGTLFGLLGVHALRLVCDTTSKRNHIQLQRALEAQSRKRKLQGTTSINARYPTTPGRESTTRRLFGSNTSPTKAIGQPRSGIKKRLLEVLEEESEVDGAYAMAKVPRPSKVHSQHRNRKSGSRKSLSNPNPMFEGQASLASISSDGDSATRSLTPPVVGVELEDGIEEMPATLPRLSSSLNDEGITTEIEDGLSISFVSRNPAFVSPTSTALETLQSPRASEISPITPQIQVEMSPAKKSWRKAMLLVKTTRMFQFKSEPEPLPAEEELIYQQSDNITPTGSAEHFEIRMGVAEASQEHSSNKHFKKRRNAMKKKGKYRKPVELSDNAPVVFTSQTSGHLGRNRELPNFGVALESIKSNKIRVLYNIEFKNVAYKSFVAGVSGSFSHKHLTAIMGPSGSGKTTILNLIAGKVPLTSGKVMVNGKYEPNGLSRFKRNVGFVPQEDTMHRMLTVRQNIEFSARLKLPKHWTEPQVVHMVQKTMLSLHLLDKEELQYTQIGDERMRGISGGERKRVNIAMELVGFPSILLLDEPTSGLDSSTSVDLCALLRNLAKNEMLTIAAVIHSPPQGAYMQFDDLLLLEKGGRVGYHGKAEKAYQLMCHFGYPKMEKTQSIPDYLLDIVSGIIPSSTKGPKRLSERFEGVEGNEESSTFVLPDTSTSSLNRASILAWGRRSFIPANYRHDPNDRRIRGVAHQLYLCMVRAWRIHFNKFSSILISLLVHLFGGIVAGMTAGEGVVAPGQVVECGVLRNPIDQLKCAVIDIQKLLLLGLLSTLIISFLGVTNGIGTFGPEKAIYWREVQAGLKTISYFLGKGIIDMVRVTLASLAFVSGFVVTYPSTGALSRLYVVAWLAYCQAFVIGWFVSIIVNEDIAGILGAVIVIVMNTVFSGLMPFYVEIEENFGTTIFWDMNGARYLIQAFTCNEINPYTGYINFTTFLDVYGFKEDAYEDSILNVGISIIVWAALSLVLMISLNRSKKK